MTVRDPPLGLGELAHDLPAQGARARGCGKAS